MPKLSSIFDVSAIVAVLIFVGGIQQASADDNFVKPLERPDPASVAVPDLTFTPTRSDIGGYDEYYYFYKAGVSYENAFADLDQCRMYVLSTRVSAMVPRFAPLGSEMIENRTQVGSDFFWLQWGIVGGIIVGVLIQQATDEFAHATENRCMAYKGYSRYGTSSDIWDKINEGNDTEKLARQALIASGSEPTAKALDP